MPDKAPHDASVFVGSLPSNVEHNELARLLQGHLSDHAQVKNIKVIRDSKGGICAFVQCEDANAASALIHTLRTTTPRPFLGRTLRFEPARAFRTLLISYRAPSYIVPGCIAPQVDPAELPTVLRIWKTPGTKFCQIAYNADAEAAEVGEHAQDGEKASPSENDRLYLHPLTFDDDAIFKMASYFGTLDKVEVVGEAMSHSEDNAQEHGRYMNPHQAPRLPAMSNKIWEVKWEWRDDCVGALMTLRRIPHLTVTWAHQPHSANSDFYGAARAGSRPSLPHALSYHTAGNIGAHALPGANTVQVYGGETGLGGCPQHGPPFWTPSQWQPQPQLSASGHHIHAHAHAQIQPQFPYLNLSPSPSMLQPSSVQPLGYESSLVSDKEAVVIAGDSPERGSSGGRELYDWTATGNTASPTAGTSVLTDPSHGHIDESGQRPFVWDDKQFTNTEEQKSFSGLRRGERVRHSFMGRDGSDQNLLSYSDAYADADGPGILNSSEFPSVINLATLPTAHSLSSMTSATTLCNFSSSANKSHGHPPSGSTLANITPSASTTTIADAVQETSNRPSTNTKARKIADAPYPAQEVPQAIPTFSELREATEMVPGLRPTSTINAYPPTPITPTNNWHAQNRARAARDSPTFVPRGIGQYGVKDGLDGKHTAGRVSLSGKSFGAAQVAENLGMDGGLSKMSGLELTPVGNHHPTLHVGRVQLGSPVHVNSPNSSTHARRAGHTALMAPGVASIHNQTHTHVHIPVIDPTSLFVGGLSLEDSDGDGDENAGEVAEGGEARVRRTPWTEQRVWEYFGRYGGLENVKFVRGNESMTAFAFLKYDNVEGPAKAVAEEHGRVIDGRTLRVQLRDCNPPRSQWKNQRGLGGSGGNGLSGRGGRKLFLQNNNHGRTHGHHGQQFAHGHGQGLDHQHRRLVRRDPHPVANTFIPRVYSGHVLLGPSKSLEEPVSFIETQRETQEIETESVAGEAGSQPPSRPVSTSSISTGHTAARSNTSLSPSPVPSMGLSAGNNGQRDHSESDSYVDGSESPEQPREPEKYREWYDVGVDDFDIGAYYTSTSTATPTHPPPPYPYSLPPIPPGALGLVNQHAQSNNHHHGPPPHHYGVQQAWITAQLYVQGVQGLPVHPFQGHGQGYGGLSIPQGIQAHAQSMPCIGLPYYPAYPPSLPSIHPYQGHGYAPGLSHEEGEVGGKGGGWGTTASHPLPSYYPTPANSSGGSSQHGQDKSSVSAAEVEGPGTESHVAPRSKSPEMGDVNPETRTAGTMSDAGARNTSACTGLVHALPGQGAAASGDDVSVTDNSGEPGSVDQSQTRDIHQSGTQECTDTHTDSPNWATYGHPFFHQPPSLSASPYAQAIPWPRAPMYGGVGASQASPQQVPAHQRGSYHQHATSHTAHGREHGNGRGGGQHHSGTARRDRRDFGLRGHGQGQRNQHYYHGQQHHSNFGHQYHDSHHGGRGGHGHSTRGHGHQYRVSSANNRYRGVGGGGGGEAGVGAVAEGGGSAGGGEQRQRQQIPAFVPKGGNKLMNR